MTKKTGFTLIVMQVFAYIGTGISGNLQISSIPEFIGFNVFGIIGIIMLIRDKNKML